MRAGTLKVGLVALAVVLVAGACRGTPYRGFNGGVPVPVPALVYFTQGPVVPAPDGSVLAITVGEEPSATMLSPDGSVDTAWGTGGTTVLPFAPLLVEAGNVAPDGSAVLIGWENHWNRIAIRLTPGGALDGSYGGDGSVLLTEQFNGTVDFGACDIAADNAIRCVGNEFTSDQLTVRDLDSAGALASEVDVVVDLDRFARSVPPQADWSDFFVNVQAMAPVADGAVVAVSVVTAWSDEVSYNPSEADAVVMRVEGGALDTAYGDDGYAFFDLEATGSTASQGAGEDTAYVTDLAHSDTAGTTLVAGIQDTPCCIDVLSVGMRLTPDGTLDASAAGGGLWPITLPDSTQVDDVTRSIRPDGTITAGGTVADGGGTRGVVLRYLPDGTLDPKFATAGVASIPGSRDIVGVDARFNRVTLGARGSATGPGGEVDVLVTVLHG